MRQKFNPGEKVWVVERDEVGSDCGIAGFIFLAEVADAVIVTPKICGREGLEEIMAYHIEETAEMDEADLPVYPAKDCYMFRADAEKAVMEG